MDRQKFALRFFPSLSDFAFLAPAVLLFAVMGGTRVMLSDGDTGWHIRSGDWILEHGRPPAIDFFSFTKPGQPWYAFEWLWDVSFAWLHGRAGMAAGTLSSAARIWPSSPLLSSRGPSAGRND